MLSLVKFFLCAENSCIGLGKRYINKQNKNNANINKQKHLARGFYISNSKSDLTLFVQRGSENIRR